MNLLTMKTISKLFTVTHSHAHSLTFNLTLNNDPYFNTNNNDNKNKTSDRHTILQVCVSFAVSMKFYVAKHSLVRVQGLSQSSLLISVGSHNGPPLGFDDDGLT